MVKNIIFDLGGVLLNIDYEAPVRAFRQAGLGNFHELYSQAQQSTLFDDFETGKISSAQFRDQIRVLCNKNVDDSVIDHAWNSILLDLPAQRIELLQKLKKTYRIFLLSNTNAVHVACFERSIIEQFGTNVFDQLFEGKHYSNELGMRKPHADTFKHVLELHGLLASETLFIDDSAQHVRGAKEAGLHAHWLDVKNVDILNFFATFNFNQ